MSQRTELIQFPGDLNESRLHELSKRALLSQDVTTTVRSETGAAITPGDDDHVILADPSAGPVIVTLPPATTVEYRQYIVKRTSNVANAVTITPVVPELIDGAINFVLAAGTFDSVTVVSDGAAWWIV